MQFLKYYIALLVNNYKLLIFTTSFSVFLLVVVSPLISFPFLVLITFYFLYKKNYKDIFLLWSLFFFSWYIIFTGCLLDFDGSIKIGNIGCGNSLEDTQRIYFFIKKYLSTGSILEIFCLNTFFLLGLLSEAIGHPIYVPSILKGILFFLKLIFGGKGSSAECSPKKNPDNPFTEEKSEDFNSKSKLDTLQTCIELQKRLRKFSTFSDNFKVYKEEKHVEGNTIIRYGEAYIPFFINKIYCFSEKASASEIADSKKF